MANSTSGSLVSRRAFLPDWPLPIWMILISLLLGVWSGMPSPDIVSLFNTGWGLALGEFALILIPSFTIAAAIDRQGISAPPNIAVGLAPFLGAGMVCPDTAYAALSPMIKRRKLSMAFGAYAGFKLLLPAGPLIVATSLGVANGKVVAFCVLVFVPVWVAGLLYARAVERRFDGVLDQTRDPGRPHAFALLWPFALLAGLLALGFFVDLSSSPVLDFATNPKGALLLTAVAALSTVKASERRACLESGLRRSGSLLLIIGAASAFSAVLTEIVPIERIFLAQSGGLALVSLFSMTALFKVMQGSSMATFAAVGPVAFPIVEAADVSPVLAVLAVCLGSFIAILPNDSFYWLVRKSALSNRSETTALLLLSGGATLQAVVGFGVVMGLYVLGIG
ncbi:MAG: hypothetical protein AAFY03_00780 [Pseudomonadota bacterium]